MVEINTTFKFEDKEKVSKKAYSSNTYEVKEKELEKIILCEVHPDLEKLLDLLHNSGYPGIKIEKVDFENYITVLQLK